MSLDYDLSKITDSDKVCWVDNRLDPYTGKVGVGMNPVTESLIFATMPIGFGDITELNYKKFHARLHKWELLVGNFLGKRGPISLEDVQRHIGLRTNVFPQRTERAFEKNLLDAALRQAEIRIKIDAIQQEEREGKRAKRSKWRNKAKEKEAAAK